MGKKKGNKSYAAAAASAGRQATASDQGAPSGSASPSTPHPTETLSTLAPTQGRGTPSTRTPAARPDHSKSLNKFAAITEEDELPDGESTSEHGEDDDPETEEEEEEREVVKTPRTTCAEGNGHQLARDGRNMVVGSPPGTRHGRNVTPEMGYRPGDGIVWGNSS